MQFSELLANTSRIADRLAVVRSMHHKTPVTNAHPQGTQYVLSGSVPGGSVEMPDIGGVVAYLQGSDCAYLPPYIMVPGNHEQAAMTRQGFLPASVKVFKTAGKDLSDPKWQVADLRLAGSIDRERFRDRLDLLSDLNIGLAVSSGESVASMSAMYDQATYVLTSPKTSAAFRLDDEPDPLRDAYGRGHRGQCYLLGRKLIEAGVRFVTVDVREPQSAQTPGGFNMNWDHHDYMYRNGSCGTVRNAAGGEGRYGIATWPMMGSTDQAFAALIDDLDQRGLLAETLVCFVTEFGRTPRLNKFEGRDHWNNAYSIVMAGAGIPGGQIVGRTDKDGGYILDNPVTVEDYAASIYEKLGIDRTRPLYMSGNRPVFLAEPAVAIDNLF
jgi:hypothetical protein